MGRGEWVAGREGGRDRREWFPTVMFVFIITSLDLESPRRHTSGCVEGVSRGV